jgi:tetratricopeptide (TPR) repeat protein
MALLDYEQGQIGEAISVMRRVLEVYDASLPPADPIRLRAEIDLADFLVVEGRAEEARDRLESILSRLANPDETNLELYLDAEWGMSSALGFLGEWNEAIRRLEAVIGLERRRSSGLSPDLATYLNDLALTLYDAGLCSRAETAIRESLDLKRHLFEAPHPEISAALSNFGLILQAQGRQMHPCGRRDRRASMPCPARRRESLQLRVDHLEDLIELRAIARACLDEQFCDFWHASTF